MLKKKFHAMMVEIILNSNSSLENLECQHHISFENSNSLLGRKLTPLVAKNDAFGYALLELPLTWVSSVSTSALLCSSFLLILYYIVGGLDATNLDSLY